MLLQIAIAVVPAKEREQRRDAQGHQGKLQQSAGKLAVRPPEDGPKDEQHHECQKTLGSDAQNGGKDEIDDHGQSPYADDNQRTDYVAQILRLMN